MIEFKTIHKKNPDPHNNKYKNCRKYWLNTKNTDFFLKSLLQNMNTILLDDGGKHISSFFQAQSDFYSQSTIL